MHDGMTDECDYVLLAAITYLRSFEGTRVLYLYKKLWITICNVSYLFDHVCYTLLSDEIKWYTFVSALRSCVD